MADVVEIGLALWLLDEAERKAQGEASALISTVRKAPQPSAGK